MTQRIKIILSAAAAGIGLFLLQHFDVIRKIPGFQCESFGCIGNGLFYFLLYFAVPLVFMVASALLCQADRVNAAITGFVASAMCAGLAFGTVTMLHTAKINRDVCTAIKRCQLDPRLCTWELEQSTRHQYPRCFGRE